VAYPAMAIVAENDDQLARGRDQMRMRLAFYGSTPAYKVVLDAHGWGDLQPELNRMTKTGGRGQVNALITHEVRATVCVHGAPEEIAGRMQARYGDLVQRVSVDTPAPLTPEQTQRVLAGFH